MAMCEKCKKSGYAPDQMFIEADLFVGPCCATPDLSRVRLRGIPAQVHILPAEPEGVEYGIELSNKHGVQAYARYEGLRVSFERTPEQLREWAEKNGIVDQKKTG